MKSRTGGTEIDSELMEAMIDNAWELLKMMRIYIPSQNLQIPRLHVTLLKSVQITLDEKDYGWLKLSSTTTIDMPFSHESMLQDCNTSTIVDIILQIMKKLNEQKQ